MRQKSFVQEALWWNHCVRFEGLAPTATGGISGHISADGGWCSPGNWNAPISNVEQDIRPETTNATMQLFCDTLATKLGLTPEQVVAGIGQTLETLKDVQDAASAAEAAAQAAAEAERQAALQAEKKAIQAAADAAPTNE